MRHIEKMEPPAALVAYTNHPTVAFDDFPHKDVVRAALTEEQGHLCCYCMRRISPSDSGMKIEHWVPQAVAPERRYEWRNLLGACDGGQGMSRPLQTCDTRKGGTPITVNPTRVEHMRRVHCLGDGRLRSDDPAMQHDIDDALNLNSEMLVNVRKATLGAALSELAKRHKGHWPRPVMERELERWRPSTVSGKLREFCEVVAQELERRLARE